MTVILLLVALACAPHAPAAAVVAPAPAIEAPPLAMAPTPYTADQLREGMPVGTVMRYRVVEAGKPPVIAETRVTGADAASATFGGQDFTEDGAAVGDPTSFSAPWAELRDHASFPAANTVIGASAYETPAGRFETTSYEVTLPTESGGQQILRFQFARELPGPPVHMEVLVDGVTVHEMVLLERRAP